MANHSYIKTRKHIYFDKLKEKLEDIIKRRFFNMFEIEIDEESDGFCIKYEKDNYYFWLQMWLETRGTIEFRNPGFGDFVWWVFLVIQNELATIYDGTILDYGIPDTRLKGDLSKLTTFKTYIYSRNKGTLSDDAFKTNRLFMWKIVMADLPKEFDVFLK